VSNWIETKRKLPGEWTEVLGYAYFEGRGSWKYGLCKWTTGSDGKRLWMFNGTSGPGVPEPKYWQPLPEAPK